MSQFDQIRERFLADARVHFLVPDTMTRNCNVDRCHDGIARDTNETAQRPRTIEE